MGLLHDNGEAYELWNGEVHLDSAQCFFEVELVPEHQHSRWAYATTTSTHGKNSTTKRASTYRYIQFDVSRLGEPVNHSGAKVIQPV